MRGRGPLGSLAASPTMVGAVTTLIIILAVFLAYNANNGLPFVPAYRVSVEVPNAARLTANNEVRIGGVRVGVVESMEPVAASTEALTAATTPDAPPEAAELPTTTARLTLKLDKGVADPLPKDSVFRIRYRSVFGLKYLEIVRGTGPPAPEGHMFTGTDDGELCELPTDSGKFATSPEASNGCFQGQTEFDEVNDTYDEPTRDAQRENLEGFGNALTGRGISLNETIAELPRLFGALRPVGRVLSDPDTNLSRFINGLERTARYTAPVAEEQALGFAFASIAFTAITSDPERLKESITEAPLTYAVGVRLLPAQRAFLGRVETFARLMRPAVDDLRVTLPVLNDAIEHGTPVLREAPPVNRRLRQVMVELNQLVQAPTTRLTLQRLRETFDTAEPLARYVAPAQTVCNLWNYWFTHLPGGLTEPSQVGYSLRQMLTRYPGVGAAEVGIGGYAGIGANGKTGAASTAPGEFRPYEIPIVNTHPYGPTGQDGSDCQPGQAGYPLGRLQVPAQANADPGNKLSDLPGSRGPTTLFWDANQERQLFDSRVASRQPATWDRVGP